jgi:uncharacterized membrane protein YobD (UPF0266 family)
MRLGRYCVGAFILAILAILFSNSFLEQNPFLAAVLVAAFVLLVIYGGILKFRQGG